MQRKPTNIILYLAVGLLIGLLAIQQFYAYQQLNRLSPRDQTTNAFRAIKVLQENNQGLTREIGALEAKLKEYANQAQKSQVIQEDIHKNQLLSGAIPVTGPGISISINRAVEATWMVDLFNELFAAGAEAVSVNDVRLTPTTLGLTYVGQQLTLGDVTLTPPFQINAIGEPEVLKISLSQSGGILKRLQAQYPDAAIEAREEDAVAMPANTQ